MENWWNDTDRAQQKYSEKNVYQRYFVHHKSYTAWSGMEPGSPRRGRRI